MGAKRVCIYPKDVQLLMGRSGSYSRRIIRLIKEQNGKSKKQPVTIAEFCEYLGLDKDEIMAMLN